MHTLLAFLTLLFSMSHAASIRHTLSIQPDPQSIATSEPALSRADIVRYQENRSQENRSQENRSQEGSVYSGTECISCQKTNLTYSAR